MRIVVVFPEPDGPITPTTEPAGMTMSRASTATVPLNRRVTPAMRTATSDSMAASSWVGLRGAWPVTDCRQATARADDHGSRVAAHSPQMGRGLATLLLAIVGIGAFLSGLELMITAVALPAIVVDLADWTELRAASWIINGYLLVSIVVMPLAGQLADRHGVRRVFLWALVVFVVGSVLAGRAATLGELIAARLVQATGGGALVPVATAAASHLYGGPARARALGAVGALTFLGMAAGPFVGAWVLQSIHPAGVLAALGIGGGLADALAASWRYVFYLNVPIGLALLGIGWAATAGWETPRREHRLDLGGATAVSVGLAALLLGITVAGGEPVPGLPVDPTVISGLLLALAAGAIVSAVVMAGRRREPFLDPRWFRSASFASAALVSLLTGYGFATAIIGGAVFVDRVPMADQISSASPSGRSPRPRPEARSSPGWRCARWGCA